MAGEPYCNDFHEEYKSACGWCVEALRKNWHTLRAENARLQERVETVTAAERVTHKEWDKTLDELAALQARVEEAEGKEDARWNLVFAHHRGEETCPDLTDACWGCSLRDAEALAERRKEAEELLHQRPDGPWNDSGSLDPSMNAESWEEKVAAYLAATEEDEKST